MGVRSLSVMDGKGFEVHEICFYIFPFFPKRNIKTKTLRSKNNLVIPSEYG
jgi:hypothetical protein